MNTTMHKTQKEILRYNLDCVKHLPDPDAEVRQSELHPRLQSLVDKLTTANIFDKAGEVPVSEDRSDMVRVWTLREDAHEYVRDLLDQRDDYSAPALPCGDHGFVNEGDAIACKFDDCEHAWAKADLRAFWADGRLPTPLPDTVACDACSGVAEQLPSSGEDLDGVTMHYYDCQDCAEGGHVEIDGDEQRRVGPVFDAKRYNAPADRPEVVASD